MFRVSGFGFEEFKVWGFGFRFEGLRLGFRVEGMGWGFWVFGSGV